MTRHGLDKTILAAALAVSLGGCTGLGNTEGDWLCPTAQGEGRTIAQADRADGGSPPPAREDVPAARPVSDIPAADTFRRRWTPKRSRPRRTIGARR